MAILFPVATKAAYQSDPQDEDLMISVIASILSGSVFGDHISPISDTTILSSIACRCAASAPAACYCTCRNIPAQPFDSFIFDQVLFADLMPCSTFADFQAVEHAHRCTNVVRVDVRKSCLHAGVI